MFAYQNLLPSSLRKLCERGGNTSAAHISSPPSSTTEYYGYSVPLLPLRYAVDLVCRSHDDGHH